MDSSQFVIDSSTLAEIVQNLSTKLRAYYVFPEVAEQICARLQEGLAQGAFAEFTDGESLALALTLRLQEVNQDRHLGVEYHPQPLPEQEGALYQNQAMVDEWRKEDEQDNFGLHKAERLPGNVGYLDIRAFSRTDWGGETAAAAMTFLAHTNALIIDLRQCRGGDPDMVALISTYLFGEERLHLNSLYWREGDVTQQFWTLPYVPGRRFGDKPVYVLTSKNTFSGGEEFAYNLQTRQRATLVGETTGGGANPGAAYRLHAHFAVFIPNGRAINPVTGTNWEGCGVTPDVQTPPEQAFNKAYQLALEGILQSVGEGRGLPAALLAEAQAALQSLKNASLEPNT
ncbi:MAG: S41 family peptidase [Chloroflexota bacterium]